MEKLNVEHGGENRMKPGLRKYVCDLTLDLNTVNRRLSLSEENRKVTWRREEQPYPDHPERFEGYRQVLCREGLTGRCYWEGEWSGRRSDIGVTYKGINRRGRVEDCGLGYNDKSWSLDCSDYSYIACHNNNDTTIDVRPSSSHRVGVYLDWPAGTLSFYRASSDTLTHLITFTSTFTEPLYPGFRVHDDTSVSLCHVVPVSCGPCVMWSLCHVVPVSCGPCVRWSLCQVVPVSGGPCIMWSLCHVVPVSGGPCVRWSLCHVVPVWSLCQVVPVSGGPCVRWSLCHVVPVSCGPCVMWSLCHVVPVWSLCHVVPVSNT
uniref:stonustoxin subunit beta-like n=1 Tax=Oncorhynchus gorbuscha TaxID=8017 RepID=UPI001EAE868B|nr:stonustoxin subunit beta-like [Oncorhynchus gorbuscha]